MKKIIQSFFTLLLITATLGLFISQYQQTTTGGDNYYVNPSTGDDNTGDGSSGNPWQSLTHALTQVPLNNNNTIHLAAGVYTTATGEQFPITVTGAVNIIGADTNNTIIDMENVTTFGYHGIYLNGDNHPFTHISHVRNLTIRNGYRGLVLFSTSNYNIDFQFRDLDLSGNSHIGLHLATQSNGTVTGQITNSNITNNDIGILFSNYGIMSVDIIDTTVANNLDSGIFVKANAQTAQTTAHLKRVNVTSNQVGVEQTGDGGGHINILLEESMIHNNNQYGYYWHNQSGNTTFNTQIINNIIADNFDGGIYIEYTPTIASFDIIHNTIVNNNDYGIFWHKGINNNSLTMNAINNIIWNPNGDDLATNGDDWSTNDITHSIIEDGDPHLMTTNYSQDPELDNTYHLMNCSSIAQDNGLITNDLPTIDIDGEPRNDGAPDIGADEKANDCALTTSVAFSTDNPVLSFPINYTFTLHNNSETSQTTHFYDPLPTGLTYNTDTLWTSQDTAIITDNIISWTTNIAPQQTISIGFQINVTHEDSPNLHYATVTTMPEDGFYTINASIAPYQGATYLPITYKQYCGSAFSDTFDNPNSGWPSGITQSGLRYGYTDPGHYQLYLPQENQWFAVTRNDYWNSSEKVETTGHIGNNANGYYGLLFGLNNDWSDFYAFEVLPQYNRWAMTHFNSNTGWSIVDIQEISLNNSLNTLAIVNNPNHANQMFLQVNGTTVKTLGHHLGRVGLTGGAFTNNIDIRHDNYLFADTNCPTPLNLTNKTAPKHIPQLPQSLIETAIANQ
ncbi:MAG TPA: right-handed parallel beta-helix repeat-containing protein [Anaerolineae bacterium]|nr:right-handed parallel beta-helix repeat-containing protein [Anaerolineae bacterium]